MTQIGKVERPTGGFYDDPLDPTFVVPSVTTAMSRTESKPWFEGSKVKMAVRYFIRHLTRLAAMVATGAVDAAFNEVISAADLQWDLKADIGSYVHNVVEQLVLDATVMPEIPEHLQDRVVTYGDESIVIGQEWLDTIVDGFLAFVADFRPVFEFAELTVVNVTARWAGTLDLIVTLEGLDGRVWMVDVKTGKVVDPDVREQLNVYRRAEVMWLDSLGNRRPMVPVDAMAVLHLRPEFRRGYKLIPIADDPALYEKFLKRLAVMGENQERPRLSETPLYPALPDGSQPLPYVEDVDATGYNKIRNVLVRAGFDRVDDLAKFTEAEVLAVKGVGPAAITNIRAVLATYGLSFADEQNEQVA